MGFLIQVIFNISRLQAQIKKEKEEEQTKP
jgi:hypothetical protein